MAKVIHDVDFRVKKNAEGRLFIKLLRKYKNAEKYSSILARTRGPRDPGQNEQATEKQATGYAIYMRSSKGVQRRDGDKARANYLLQRQEDQELRRLNQVEIDFDEYKAIAQVLADDQKKCNEETLERIRLQTRRIIKLKKDRKWMGWIAFALGMSSLAQSVYLVMR